MRCDNCGEENRDAARFCSDCGAPVAAAPATEPAPAQTATPATEPAPSQTAAPVATRCVFHQDATATGICASCGRSTCQHCSKKVGNANYCLACAGQPVQTSTPVVASALVPQQQAVSAQTALAPMTAFLMEHVYESYFNVNDIAPDMRESLKRHGMRKFPTAVAILLHFVTLGIFTIIYYGLKHSELPKIKSDDFSAGRAIGFLFIPFYNIYWEFKFWLRLCDRINFQCKLRNMGSPVPRGLLLATVIVGLIPYINLISWAILLPISIGFIQSAINKLYKADAMQVLASMPVPVYAAGPALDPQIQPSNSQAD